MEGGKAVSHDGEVTAVDNGHYQVKIITKSACTGCHSSKYCSVADMKEKTIDVFSDRKFAVGEQVVVKLEETKGMFAVFIGFFMPLTILVATLGIMLSLGYTEMQGAFTTLGALTVYYLLLWTLRGRMKKEFSFKIEKKNTN